MKRMLFFVVLLVQGSAYGQISAQTIRLKDAVADFPRSQLQLKTKGPISLEVNQGERAAYESLAAIAGLNVIIDPDFRDSSGGAWRIENADVLQAFDLLSARSGSFVEVLNSNTIIVSPDNQTKRRDYEQIVIKTFYLPNGAAPERLTEIVTALRTTLNVRYLAQSQTANAVVMRDNPVRIAAAEKIIGTTIPLVAGPAAATIGDSIRGNGHILTLNNSDLGDGTPARSVLNSTGKNNISLELKESTRALYERLARSAGLNVIFDPDFRNIEGHAFKVDQLDILDAIDVLAFETRTFWEPIDSQTIVVAPDNQGKRRDLESVYVKTFHLPNASQVEMTEIVTSLRTLLNARYLALVSDSKSIIMRDNATKVALAEKIVSDLRKSGGVVASAGFLTGSESGSVLNRRAAQKLSASPSALQSKVRGPLSFDANDTVRAAYESIAATAGLRAVFDSRFQDAPAMPFHVENVGIVDALDFLALQTRTIWQVMEPDTIILAPDNQTVRAELVPRVTKTLSSASRSGTPRNITELITLLRTILNIRQISPLDNSIIVSDTAENVAFSEKLLQELDAIAAR